MLLAGIIPDTIKAPGVTGRVPDGMANVAVAEIILDKRVSMPILASAKPQEWRNMCG